MANNQRALNVRFGADTGELTKGITELRQKLTQLNTTFAENKQKISDTNTELKKLQKEERELSAAMKDGGTKEQQAQMQELKDKIAQTTANLGQLRATEAEIKADIKKTTTNLQEQKAALDGNTKSTGLLEKALGKLGTTAKAFIGVYGAKKLWELLIGSNAEMEQYQTSFEVMLGDAEKAKRMIEDMRDFAAKTPLAMSDVISAGSLLMNYGVADNNLIGTMTKLGDLASGNAEKLNRVALAYGQMLAKGKVSGEELRQMTEAGVPLQDALAKSIGVTGEEFSKMVSAGKVGIDDLNKAIDSLTTGNGKFAGMMDKQSQTMNGMFSTLKDNVTEFLRQMGEGAFGEVKDVLADVMEQMKQWEEDGTLEKWAKELGTTIANLVKLLKGAIEVIFEFKDEIIAAFAGKAVYSMVSGFLPACKKVFKGLKDITAGAKSSAAAMNIYALAAAAVVAIMVEAYQKAQEANAVLQEYRDTMLSLEKAGNENINRTKAEMSILESKGKRYEELRTAAELTAAEEAELKGIAEELQVILGDNVTVIDKKTQAYNDLTDALNDYINKQIEAAQKEAAYNTLVEAETQKLSAEQQLKELTEGREEFFDALANDPAVKSMFGNADSRGFMSVFEGINQFAPSNFITSITGNLQGATNEEIREYFQLIEILADAEKQAESATNTLGDFERAEYEAGGAADDTSDKVNDLTETIEDQADAISDLNNMLDTLSSAYKEQQDNGQLSYKTIMSLIDAGYAQCLQIDNETNAVRINADAYRELAKAKIEARMTEIRAQSIAADKDEPAIMKGIRFGLSPLSVETNAELAALQQMLDNLDGYMSGGSSYNPYSRGSGGGYSDAYNAYKTEADKKMQLIKDELAAKKELRDKTIAYLDEEIKKRKELNQDTDMQEQIDKVKAQLEYAQLDEFSRGQLEKELKDLEEERDEMLWQREMQAKKDEANAAYETAAENAAKAQEQITNAVNTVKEIMDNLANGITNISNIVSNNTNTVNNTANINLASQWLTQAQITEAVRKALIGTVLIR